ncbi:uncharacterized protein ATNIH1004_006647 [Aspergillus tanneri]|uniref:Uncharacterized protein n=1 Tax=Aspergillus tanneri TaxID=1220188 RepID=A0A5M9ME26_9EURO|nr:uncharacterized protein ATNIH1004_006647 [Aspergillus tanneri]KAA8645228.1 hypothetical protein ATNIH1004_006647 [Aspergillus tanneri]
MPTDAGGRVIDTLLIMTGATLEAEYQLQINTINAVTCILLRGRRAARASTNSTSRLALSKTNESREGRV